MIPAGLTRAELRTLEDAAETEERLAQAETQEATARAHRARVRAHLLRVRIAEIDERPEDVGCDLGGAYFYADLAEHHEGYAAGYRKSYEERLATLARRERTRESAVDAGKPAAVRAIGDLTALTEAQRDGRACIRRIVQIDTASVTPGGDYDGPPVDGWEVTVTTGAGPVEIFHVWKDPDVFEEEWHVEELAPRESWGRFRSMGDALMQILSPESGEIDDPAPRRIPRGGR